MAGEYDPQKIASVPGQRRVGPQSFWIPAEFHTFDEIGWCTLPAVGAFLMSSVWSAKYRHPLMPWSLLKHRVPSNAVRELESSGLWTRVSGKFGVEFGIKTMEELRAGRGRRGQIIRVSRAALDSAPVGTAGLAGMGLWALAASWSLSTQTPGYITTGDALRIGKWKAIGKLYEAGLWKVEEFGFYMAKGSPSLEEFWSLARDDERADIPPELRARVWERDRGECRECAAKDDLTLDHIVPWILGGPDTYENLRLLCRPCNSSKGARQE